MMMDKLQSAMDRLKDQDPTTPHVPPRQNGSHSGLPQAVVYSRTRSIPLDEQVLREHRILMGHNSPFADAYKILRTQVLHRLRENGWNMLGITSPRDGEGKTLTSINLAIALAAEPTQTVLLVDADLRAPRIHEEFGLESGPGLTEYLLDGRSLEDLLVHPAVGRLILLPGGRGTAQSAEVLATPRMTALGKELKHRYASRVVLFDLPPALDRADVLAFSPQLDALLLVVEDGNTSEVDFKHAVQVLKGSAPILGTVLNKSGREELNLPRVRQLTSVDGTQIK